MKLSKRRRFGTKRPRNRTSVDDAPSVTYRNPWHEPDDARYGPKFYQTNARPFKHAGCLIYQRIAGKVWDVVYDGVCLSQRAGRGGAKEAAEICRRKNYHPEMRNETRQH